MKTKRKNKYTELRAVIAAVRKVNRGLLRVLPQWRYDGERFAHHAGAGVLGDPPQGMGRSEAVAIVLNLK